MVKTLDTPVKYLKGVGPKRAKVLNKIGIYTIEDLFYYFPRRYEDRSNFTPISKIEEGKTYTLKAKVLAKGKRNSWRRRNFSILEAVVGDDTGKISCIWFNQPYLEDYLKVNQEIILYGKVQRHVNTLQINSPEFEIIDSRRPSLNIGRIVGIYTLPQGITQRYLRPLIKRALDGFVSSLKDALPYDLRKRYNLLNLAQSLINIHFPESLQLQEQALRRLCFEEFFLFQILLVLKKLRKNSRPGIAHRIERGLIRAFIESLPFRLTAAQQEAVEQIKQDMARAWPMQRLLQGDVGSGKTVVGTISAMIAIGGGYQVAFMVPTEILARQHFEKIRHQISGLRYQNRKITVTLLTSNIKGKQRKKVYQDIKKGRIDLIIGTVALIQEEVEFKNLGLVIIDEQHKFGVAQRNLLQQKAKNADVLVMTATPIPRTLAITLYADMDISIIDQLPAGRKPINTWFITPDKREQLYAFLKKVVNRGRQVYIVYPLIQESYNLDLYAAEKMYEMLQKEFPPFFKIGLIHARLKDRQQHKIMNEFKAGKINILVATTILEVGLDIPNATVMVIENADRFGLSQLHQLRGRVGRGEDESYCILVAQPQTEEAKARIRAMLESCDGFRIAEQDLKIRGPGEFFGKRQHGLCELRIANPLTQMRLLKTAREEAIRLLDRDPGLNLKQNQALQEALDKRFPGYEKFVAVG
jgi:ATP-dependent DNA helicase RecG